MIRHLMREQARAHRAYLIWTSALLTLAIAMAAFAAFSAAQQNAVQAHARQVFGLDGEWSRSLNVDSTVPGIAAMPRSELDAVLDAADNQGASTAGSHEVGGVQVAADTGGAITQEDLWWGPALRGTRGAVDWDAVLLDGTPPGAGEIALNAIAAEALRVGVGDSVAVLTERADGYGVGQSVATLIVSGLTRTGVQERYELFGATGLVEWDQSFALEEAARTARGDSDGLIVGAFVNISAQRYVSALERIAESNPSLVWFGGNSVDNGVLTALAITASVLVVGLVGMAFAVGRSQAQARTQWVATARVLGARRASIVLATLGEVVLLGLIAGLVGTCAAAIAMELDWNAFVADHGTALLPPDVRTPTWMHAAFVGLGVMVAGVMGTIPAFWAARVSPAAALKPITPVSQAELSRRVSPGWIYGLWTATFGALVWVVAVDRGTDAWLWTLGTLALMAGVVTVAALAEAARALVTRLGRRLARGSRAWELAAGDSLLGHVSQAAIPAAVFAVALTALSGIATWSSLTSWSQVFAWDWTWTGMPGWPSLPAALAVASQQSPGGMVGMPRLAIGALGCAALVLVAVAAFTSASLAQSGDDETRSALGLSRSDARRAAALRFGAPLALGALLGTVVGVVVVVATWRGYAAPRAVTDAVSVDMSAVSTGPLWALSQLGHAVVPVTLSLLAALGTVALGSLAAALMVRPDRPARTRKDVLV